MKYPYVTFPDDTEVTFSDVKNDGSVLVYIETPVEDGFRDATCSLPAYKWLSNHGYSDSDMNRWEAFLRENAHLIMQIAVAGGFEQLQQQGEFRSRKCV